MAHSELEDCPFEIDAETRCHEGALARKNCSGSLTDKRSRMKCTATRRKAARRPTAGPKKNASSLKPSNAGFTTTGCASNRAFAPRSSKGSRCSSPFSTTTPRSNGSFVPLRKPTIRRPMPMAATVSRCRRCRNWWNAARSARSIFPSRPIRAWPRPSARCMKQDFQRAVLEPHSQDRARKGPNLAGSPLPLRRVPRLCHRGRDRPERR